MPRSTAGSGRITPPQKFSGFALTFERDSGTTLLRRYALERSALAQCRGGQGPLLGAKRPPGDTEPGRRRGLGGIETIRRHFPRIFFNEATTEAGRDALGWYHEKKSNDDRNIGLGPNHDWSSHGADAFGLMCVHYDQPDGAPPRRERYRERRTSSGGGSWQSA